MLQPFSPRSGGTIGQAATDSWVHQLSVDNIVGFVYWSSSSARSKVTLNKLRIWHWVPWNWKRGPCLVYRKPTKSNWPRLLVVSFLEDLLQSLFGFASDRRIHLIPKLIPAGKTANCSKPLTLASANKGGCMDWPCDHLWWSLSECPRQLLKAEQTQTNQQKLVVVSLLL